MNLFFKIIVFFFSHLFGNICKQKHGISYFFNIKNVHFFVVQNDYVVYIKIK